MGRWFPFHFNALESNITRHAPALYDVVALGHSIQGYGCRQKMSLLESGYALFDWSQTIKEKGFKNLVCLQMMQTLVDIMFRLFGHLSMLHLWHLVSAQIRCGTWYWPSFRNAFSRQLWCAYSGKSFIAWGHGSVHLIFTISRLFFPGLIFQGSCRLYGLCWWSCGEFFLTFLQVEILFSAKFSKVFLNV